MSEKSIYGKAKKAFYKVAEHSLNGIWDYKLGDYDEIDFVEQGGGNYTLNQNEIFFIKTRDEEVEDYLYHIINTSACNSITKNNLRYLETIYVFDKINNNFHLYIQRIMPAVRVEKNWLSFFKSEHLATIIEKETSIAISNDTNLYWNQEEQKIYFRKFSDLEKVFPIFTKYYREASKEDIQNFKDTQKYPFLKVQIDFETLKKTKLQTIAMIVDELEKVKGNFEEYMRYALKYKQSFIKNDKFEISDAKDIDHLADIVFRKFYTTEAGEEEVRIANSFRILKNENRTN